MVADSTHSRPKYTSGGKSKQKGRGGNNARKDNARKSADPIDDEQKVLIQGKVIAELPSTEYMVEIEVSGVKHQLLAYISGKIRKNYIKVHEGDTVVIEISPAYNPDLGRIIYKVDPHRTLPPFITEKLLK